MCVLSFFRAFSSFRLSVQCFFLRVGLVDLELQDCVVGCCWGLDFAGIRPMLFLGPWPLSVRNPQHAGAEIASLKQAKTCWSSSGLRGIAEALNPEPGAQATKSKKRSTFSS